MKRIATMVLLLTAGFFMAQAAEPTASINIDSRVKYQHVTGFGGFTPSPTWQYWLTNTEIDKLFGKGEGQLGLNIARLYMANNKNYWSSGVANAKRVKSHGAFVFASPWSPPAAWKSNNSTSNGGELLESRWQDWANFLNDYYKYMRQQGVTIDAVSIQNEPDWKAEYESCIWTGEKMARFLKQFGHLIECKVIAPEAIHFTRNMHEPILNDPDACEQLDIVGGHFYGWDGSSYPLAAQKGKEVWMTEFLINERQNNEKKDINWKDDGFLFARSVNDAMLANMSAWVHYSLKRFYGCLGDGTYGTVDNQITKRGYILSHYAKYVAGTTRISHSLTDNTGKLSSSAYLTVTGDSIVLMVINQSDNSFKTAITLPFNTLKYSQVVTTETVNMSKSSSSLTDETYQPTVTVLPWSVSTFVFTKSSPRSDIGDNPDEGEAVFVDDFDMSGASSVPAGWRSKSEEGIRKAGNYSLGPRIMSFSPEGLMRYAFYFRSGTNGVGYVSYGEETAYRLKLIPGSYRLRFSTIGWKSNPNVSARVETTSGSVVKSISAKPTNYVSSSGSNVRVTSAANYELTFNIAEEGNYVLRWQIPAATGGLSEALVGNIKLTRDEATGITVLKEPTPVTDRQVFYDLTGRPVQNISQPGIYIRNGKKIVVR